MLYNFNKRSFFFLTFIIVLLIFSPSKTFAKKSENFLKKISKSYVFAVNLVRGSCPQQHLEYISVVEILFWSLWWSVLMSEIFMRFGVGKRVWEVVSMIGMVWYLHIYQQALKQRMPNFSRANFRFVLMSGMREVGVMYCMAIESAGSVEERGKRFLGCILEPLFLLLVVELVARIFELLYFS